MPNESALVPVPEYVMSCIRRYGSICQLDWERGGTFEARESAKAALLEAVRRAIIEAWGGRR